MPKAKISNSYVSDVHSAVQRNQKVYVKVMQIKQNPRNGKTDYSFSMRDVNQETGELQSDAPAVQSCRHQGQNSYPGQQQQQYHQGRPQPPAGYSGSKTNTIPLGKKRDFSAVSTEPQNLGRANPGTTATYQSQQPPQPSIGTNGNTAASNAAPPPPQGLFKSAPAPFNGSSTV